MSTTTKRRSPGGIGITKRGDKFEATYNVPKEQLPPGAPRKRITAWGDTEKAAEAALVAKLRTTPLAPELPEKISAAQEREMRQHLGPGAEADAKPAPAKYQNDRGPLLKDWAAEWLSDWSDGVQPSTKAVYANHLTNYIVPYIGEYHLNDLDMKTLKKHWWIPVQALRKVKGGVITDEPLLGAAALGNLYKSAHLLLAFAHEKLGTRLALNPKYIKPPKHQRPEEDWEVKQAAKKLRKIFIDEPDKNDPRWSLFALSLLGLRQAERLGIRVQDVVLDCERPVLYIYQQLDFDKSKGGWYIKNTTKNGRPREVPLWDTYLEAVEKQLEWRNKWMNDPENPWEPEEKYKDLLFLQPGGKLWTRRQDTPAWHQLVGPGIRGHLARHITGYLLAEAGISSDTAAVLLGHKSAAWSQYYRTTTQERMWDEIATIRQPRETESNITDIRAARNR